VLAIGLDFGFDYRLLLLALTLAIGYRPWAIDFGYRPWAVGLFFVGIMFRRF